MIWRITLKIKLEELLAIAVAKKDAEAIDWFLNQLKHLAKAPDSPEQTQMKDLMQDYWMAEYECDAGLIESTAWKIRLLICQISSPLVVGSKQLLQRSECWQVWSGRADACG